MSETQTEVTAQNFPETLSETTALTALQALVRRGRTVSAEISSLQEELNDISEKLRLAIPTGTKVEVDGSPVTHKKGNRKFSKLLAFALLSSEERKLVMREQVDDKKLRAVIESKGMLEEAMEPPGPDAKTSILY